MSNITLPAYFDNPAELAGQLRRTVDDDLTAAAELIFELDPIPHYDSRAGYRTYQETLFWACYGYYYYPGGLIDGEAFLRDQSISDLNRTQTHKRLLETAKLKSDPHLILLSSLSRFLAVYLRSDYVCWSDWIIHEVIQYAKEGNGWIQKDKLIYSGKGKKGTLYWFAEIRRQETDPIPLEGVNAYSGGEIILTFNLPPDPWPHDHLKSVYFRKTCIHIEEF